MSQITALLLPMIGVIFLTFGVMFWMLKLRYKAVRKDKISPRYFELNKGAKLPDYLVKVTQNFNNLLETPMLFYIAMMLIIALKTVDLLYITLSWLYFATRLMHTIIHTTSNQLAHRKNIFIINVLTLITLWLRICIDILSI